MRKGLVLGLIILCVLLCLVVMAQDHMPPPVAAGALPPLDPILTLPHHPVPNPNGYAVLEALAMRVNDTHELKGDFSGGAYHPHSREAELAAAPAQLEDNRAVLADLRRALNMEWLNPPVPPPSRLFPELSKAYYLGRLLTWQAALQDQQGQAQAAVKTLLDALTFGVKLRRGGCDMHWIKGRAIESMAFGELKRLEAGHRLSPEALAALPRRLRELERQRVPLREIIAVDYEFEGPQSLNLSASEFIDLLVASPNLVEVGKLPGADAVMRGFIPRFLPRLMAWDAQLARLSEQPYFAIRKKLAALPKDMKASDDALVLRPFFLSALKHDGQSQCQWRAARIMAVLELDRATRGKYAEKLSQLQGLTAEDLQDPFSGKPLIYRPQGDSYVLYSTGPDGKDHGGHRPKMFLADGGDLMLWPDSP